MILKRFLIPTLIILFLGIIPLNAQNIKPYSPGKLELTSDTYLAAQSKWKDVNSSYTEISGLTHEALHLLAKKCIYTLLNNRQFPIGGLKHEGIIPSYSYKDFNGFWAWDSWKHAFALAEIAPELAKNCIRAMFDYQDSRGMIADCIFADSSENNYRNTKPPLASWAVLEIVEKNSDTAFAAEMLPKLVRYHKWWYSNRDHDRNGLCEYGSTDGTLVAAKWESGWDNAVRFDSTKLVKNDLNAWSMTQESADLNAYLFVDKQSISILAKICCNNTLAKTFTADAERLAQIIQEYMWDQELGFFFDIDLKTKKRIKILEPNGWIPLWAGLATKEQAKSICNHIMSPTEFNTFIPFPTVAANNPKFNPEKGYWRGPVWIDQAYFAINGLRKHGYRMEANALMVKLFRNCEGLLDSDAPIRENYHPLSGKGLNAEHFSWSAAHVLMMIKESSNDSLIKE